MKTKHILLSSVIALIFSLCFISCNKDDTIETPPTDTILPHGKLTIKFAHKVNGQLLVTDTLLYTNAAGNTYQVQEIQYFVSDITLHHTNGSAYTIGEKNGIHYVDTDIPATHTWNVADDIPAGNYQSISFVFGINEVKNQSNMFVNPPESNMFWPEFLGGGYHYLKLNGEWIDTTGSPRLFNFHLGIGQTYAGGIITPDSITGFVQNYFTVTLPSSAFILDSAGTREIMIVMNVESWFETPHAWDFNNAVQYGWSIMQNQTAMQAAKENGADVFTIDYIQ